MSSQPYILSSKERRSWRETCLIMWTPQSELRSPGIIVTKLLLNMAIQWDECQMGLFDRIRRSSLAHPSQDFIWGTA